MSLTSDLKDVAKTLGADLVGIADLADFKSERFSLPADLLEPFNYAVSVAVKLDNETVNAITDHPTPEYAEHYREVNSKLDSITGQMSEWISGRGYLSQAIPASFIADEINLLGSVSHKAVARMAGIGWQGKSLLIISSEFGPRIRLATLLTDMPLQPDAPLKNKCGKCAKCTQACPAAAIKNISAGDRYSSRDEAIYFSKCADKTLEFKAMPGIGVRVCGVCVKVCPFGKKRASSTR